MLSLMLGETAVYQSDMGKRQTTVEKAGEVARSAYRRFDRKAINDNVAVVIRSISSLFPRADHELNGVQVIAKIRWVSEVMARS